MAILKSWWEDILRVPFPKTDVARLSSSSLGVAPLPLYSIALDSFPYEILSFPLFSLAISEVNVGEYALFLEG